ncbi:urea ABC transporter permease subunit UrtC [Kiritimatiellaeota bacterium B1221]|nr:urea ABC transporter permease subunit UrtC [Kiritimatiellaeota bacterium B1221]
MSEFNQSSVNRAKRHLVIMAVLGLGVVPLMYFIGLMPIETVNMLGRYLCFAIVAVGLDLIWGYTGILSMCQALFFTVGAYGMGMYMAHQYPSADNPLIPQSLYVVYPYDIGQGKGEEILPWFWWPFKYFPLAVFFSILVPCLMAALVGLGGFFSRVRGVYFAILTQAITVAAFLFFSNNDMFLCGTNGLSQFRTFLGFDLGDDKLKLIMYLMTALSLLGVVGLCQFVVHSRFGRILVAVRDAEPALRFQGYKPHHFKMIAFAFAGAIAGLGGMLYTPQMQIITPSNMAPIESILIVVWVAVGGRGTLTGAVIGALFVNLIYSWLTSPISIGSVRIWSPDFWPILLGLLFIAVVLVIPTGVVNMKMPAIGRKKEVEA